MLVVYSSLLLAVLVLGSPYWLMRMASSGRYRIGLSGRLGRVPSALRAATAGRDVVWLHAVSVGEVMAATQLVRELESALPGWIVVLSTTTATGQALARERFGKERVFFYPLDFAWVVRAYLRALRPKMLVLMESELWPAMLAECGRTGVPVAVVNARVSDRSLARGVHLRAVWGRILRRVDLFAAQSHEDAHRLVAMGAREARVKVAGNLKYEVRVPTQNRLADLIRDAAGDRPVIVAGSTVERLGQSTSSEEELVIHAWQEDVRQRTAAVLILAPRHPERFERVYSLMEQFGTVRATELLSGNTGPVEPGGTILLDTIGDLAAVYAVADVAFVGGSLVANGGHNPLEPAQFGVPVIMGASYENFRDMVERMREAGGIRIVKDGDELGAVLTELLEDRELARAMGERGRAVFQSQVGATAKTVGMLIGLLQDNVRVNP